MFILISLPPESNTPDGPNSQQSALHNPLGIPFSPETEIHTRQTQIARPSCSNPAQSVLRTLGLELDRKMVAPAIAEETRGIR